MGMVGVTWPIFCFNACSHISRTAEARLTNFGMQVEYIKIKCLDDRLPASGCGQGHMTHLKNWPQIISVASVKLGNSNVVCWLIQMGDSFLK